MSMAADARRELGNAHFRDGEFQEAAAAYAQALLAHGLAATERSDLLASLAAAQLKLGDAHAAARACAAARELDPHNERALRAAIKAYQQTGQHEAVLEAKYALKGAQACGADLARAPATPAAAESEPAAPRAAGYTGLSPGSDQRVVEASMNDLRDNLTPKLELLIAGVERWAAKIAEGATVAADGLRVAQLELQDMSTLEECSEPSQIVICVSFEGVALAQAKSHFTDGCSLTAALLRSAGAEPEAALAAAVSTAAGGSPTEEPAAEDTREAGWRRQAAVALRAPVADVVAATMRACGAALSEPFAEWCEVASIEQWHVCVLSASLKPVVRHFLRDAGLGHITALGADAICRAQPASDGSFVWAVSLWSAIDRVRALRGWLSSTATTAGGDALPQLVYVGAHVQDALLLRAEPPLVRTLYVLPNSQLERWCEAHGVRHRKFEGFDRLRADLAPHHRAARGR
jgi:hypothetical protein